MSSISPCRSRDIGRPLRQVARGAARGGVLDELHREHRAKPAHLADLAHARGDLPEPCANQVAESLGLRPEVVGRDLVEDGQCGGAGDWIAPERAPETAGRDGIDDLGTAGDAGEGKSAAQGLARHDEVGLDSEMLDRPDRTGTTDSGLHLVGDVEDAVLAAERTQPLEELARHRDEATLALHRLEHDTRDESGSTSALNRCSSAAIAPSVSTPRNGYGATVR